MRPPALCMQTCAAVQDQQSTAVPHVSLNQSDCSVRSEFSGLLMYEINLLHTFSQTSS